MLMYNDAYCQEVIRHVVNLTDPTMIRNYPSHGKQVQNLSKEGFNEVANYMGGYETVSFDWTQNDEFYMGTALVALNPVDVDAYGVKRPKSGRLGSAQVEKEMEIEDYKTKEKRMVVDPEAFTKCLHIAQRNALEHLIPRTIIKGIILAYTGFTARTPLDRARKKVMDMVQNDKDRTKDIEKHFGTMQRFWAEFKEHFNGVGWIDLTAEDLEYAAKQISAANTMNSLQDWLRSPYEPQKGESSD